jgi:hypothetical protein
MKNREINYVEDPNFKVKREEKLKGFLQKAIESGNDFELASTIIECANKAFPSIFHDITENFSNGYGPIEIKGDVKSDVSRIV